MKRVRNGYNAARMIADCWGLHPNWARDRQDRWDVPLQHFEWTEIQSAIYEQLEVSPVKPPTLGTVIQSLNAVRRILAGEKQLGIQGCARCDETGKLTMVQHVLHYETNTVLRVSHAVVACDCPRGQFLNVQGKLQEWRAAAEQYSKPRDVRLYITGTSYRMMRDDTVETSPWFTCPSPEELAGHYDIDRSQWQRGGSVQAAAHIEMCRRSTPEETDTSKRIALVDERGY